MPCFTVFGDILRTGVFPYIDADTLNRNAVGLGLSNIKRCCAEITVLLLCCKNLYKHKTFINEKSAQRDANTARALAVVRFGHRPPARYTPTDRTDYNTLRRS